MSEIAAALDRLSKNAHATAVWARCDDAHRDVDFRKRVIQILDQALEVSRALTLDAEATTGRVSDLALNL